MKWRAEKKARLKALEEADKHHTPVPRKDALLSSRGQLSLIVFSEQELPVGLL